MKNKRIKKCFTILCIMVFLIMISIRVLAKIQNTQKHTLNKFLQNLIKLIRYQEKNTLEMWKKLEKPMLNALTSFVNQI